MCRTRVFFRLQWIGRAKKNVPLGEFFSICHSAFDAPEVVVKRPGADAVKNSLVMPVFWLM